jgi:CubicO group peptidase (beta-lactamase class C family)
MRKIVAFFAVVAVLIAGAYGATALMNVPPPHTLAKISASEPSQWGKYFPYRTIEAGQERPLEAASAKVPSQVNFKDKDIALQEFLTSTDTNSFLVLQDGKIAHEWYAKGFDQSSLQSSFSMAKSLVSLMVGQAIDRGELSETDKLVDILPELKKGDAYDTITVQHLLDMASGVDVSEVYREYWPFTGTSRMFLTKDLKKFVKGHRNLVFKPGTKGDYRSVDTELLGLILAKVTGKNLSELLSEGVWQPMGASHSATWSLDHKDGNEKAFASVNATARDYARVGQLVLDDGLVDSERVLPIAWIDRISEPSPLPVDDWGYSAQWWHPPGGDGADLTAIGIYGQFTYVNPATRTVIVKLSDYQTSADEIDIITVFREISSALS